MDFFQQLPKVELHAHLNGSISDSTLKRLIESKKRRCSDFHVPSEAQFVVDRNRTMEEIFQMFPLIHNVVDTPEAVYTATVDVIKEFAEENVKYLELRTTAKDLCNGLTKQNYVEAVIQGIKDGEQKTNGIITVRLLLSIDRKRGLIDAYETVKIAENLHILDQSRIVGIDFSGDPSVDGKQYIELLHKAKSSGLKLSLHLAELPDTVEENLALLTLAPDRIGHGTHLHKNQESLQLMSQLQIPIEMCLSSNVKCLTVLSYDNHHFKYWLDNAHPIAICTDDKGLFQTSLSKEYQVAAETFDLSPEKMLHLSKQSVDYCFLDINTKDLLKKFWTDFTETN